MMVDKEQPPGGAITLNLFDKYQLGKLIGRGAFAKVYHARDLRTGQSVAIKSVNKQHILKGHLAAQIKREIVIMRRLRHCRIVRLHEVLATKTKIYFVMELAKGGELLAKISKGRFTEDLSRKYFRQLITAIDYCHSHGVFHRDLKPENLLLDDDWNLKISDFGLSALTDQIRPDGLLHTLCGTPAYVAPEFLAKKGYDGAKTDVWSCGVILFVLNSGYLPFNDFNIMNMYRKIHKGEFRCPKWTSPDLKRLLTRLLDPNPITRIKVNEILNDQWFNKGSNDLEISINAELAVNKDCGENYYLNAFDLISYSSGADLSGLFSSNGFSREMFMCADSKRKMVERIEGLASDDGIVVAKGEDGVVQLRRCGKLLVTVEVKPLNEEMVVVVATAELGGAAAFWEQKCKPQLINSR